MWALGSFIRLKAVRKLQNVKMVRVYSYILTFYKPRAVSEPVLYSGQLWSLYPDYSPILA